MTPVEPDNRPQLGKIGQLLKGSAKTAAAELGKKNHIALHTSDRGRYGHDHFHILIHLSVVDVF